MAWVIGPTCIDVKDRTCMDVCPTDCIYEVVRPGMLRTKLGMERPAVPEADDRMLYVRADECIDCGACEAVCPVQAIYAEDALPEGWEMWTVRNAEVFAEEAPVTA